MIFLIRILDPRGGSTREVGQDLKGIEKMIKFKTPFSNILLIKKMHGISTS